MRRRRLIIVDEYIEYEQCLTSKEIVKAVQNKTYHKHFDGMTFRKTFRERVCELFTGKPYYKVHRA